MMRLVVRWKGKVLAHLFGGYYTFIEALDVALSEVKEHVQPYPHTHNVDPLKTAFFFKWND